ncbi:uncharacterized protein LOC130426388 isoform X2 [Triplophysa dalaica]|uniref:uncharacterized protein LOC130426388 isoform X2 n=1 Tax=Triplophysa dalaica TaxID=1582913 RepID=UPI0024DFE36D|nr:uncharacterized protein LOC130426388 isoform X2 [Triplophysa dalaica]
MPSIKERPTLNSVVVKGKRPMHRSTLILGDQTKSYYSTTHEECFSGRGRDGQPLVFLPPDSLYPSQHTGKLEMISNMTTTPATTHSRDVHGPKDIVPHHVLHSTGEQNKTRNRGGLEMKDITHPNEITQYQTTYNNEHCDTSPRHLTNESSGRPIYWHSHNIITGPMLLFWTTGEERTPAGPGRLRRESGDMVLWETRRWDTQHDSFRLY